MTPFYYKNPDGTYTAGCALCEEEPDCVDIYQFQEPPSSVCFRYYFECPRCHLSSGAAFTITEARSGWNQLIEALTARMVEEES